VVGGPGCCQGSLARILLVVVWLAGCATGRGRPASSDPHWVEIPGVRLILVKDEADCGVAALATVLSFWQPNISVSEVRSALGPGSSREGLEAGRLREVARQHGVRAFLVEGVFDDLAYEIARGRPVIVGLVEQSGSRRFGHYVVVVGINTVTKTVLVADPRGSWRRLHATTLMAEWRPAHQLALFILPEESLE